MKQVAVVSGKGGTGKTSLVAAFASIENRAVIADCDVDAADLYLVLNPDVEEEHPFGSGFMAEIEIEVCSYCGLCRDLCRYDAISENFQVDALSCEGCGVCQDNCPADAVRMERVISGHWFVSETRFGPMVHAKLGIAQENSGKLVAQVRNRANEIALERDIDLVVIDGPPGIGCPVISSITGTDLILAVTEPTQSGKHDLKRILELAHHFNIGAAVCINKFDLNKSVADDIKITCSEDGAAFVGAIPYDPAVTEAMVARMSLMENSHSPAAHAAEEVWKNVLQLLE